MKKWCLRNTASLASLALQQQFKGKKKLGLSIDLITWYIIHFNYSTCQLMNQNKSQLVAYICIMFNETSLNECFKLMINSTNNTNHLRHSLCVLRTLILNMDPLSWHSA